MPFRVSSSGQARHILGAKPVSVLLCGSLPCCLNPTLPCFDGDSSNLFHLRFSLHATILYNTPYSANDANSGLADIRDSLSETDYGRFLSDHAGKLEVGDIKDKMLDKLASEFFYIRCLAGPMLGKFMDFITYEYMIENLMLILKATSNGGRSDVSEIIEQCHPLGRLDVNTMRSIASFENTPEGYRDLYRTVLVETPIGKYFERFLIETKEDVRKMKEDERQNILAEEKTTILETWLTKLYLEDFYAFCKECGGETWIVMKEILEMRADAATINITLNSFGTQLNDPAYRSERADLYPSFGKLYMHGVACCRPGDQASGNRADIINCSNFAELVRSLNCNAPEWRGILDNENDDFTQAHRSREVMLCEIAFEGQFSFACFYAYVKLKEQEVRNVEWISNCTILGQPTIMKENFIGIFDMSSPWRTGALADEHERRAARDR